MSYRRWDLTAILIGNNRVSSRRWLKIAGGLSVVACVGFAVGNVVYTTGAVNPEGFVETGRDYVSSGLVIVSLLAIAGGILAATVQAYQNGGLGVSIVIALAPVFGHSIGYMISEEVLYYVDRMAWAASEGGLYVYIVGGFFVLIIALVGFMLGAGARQVRDLLSRYQGN